MPALTSRDVPITHPLIGWKTWSVYSSSLHFSESSGKKPGPPWAWLLSEFLQREVPPWPARQAMFAQCLKGTCAQPPGQDCHCGIYARRDPASIARRIVAAGFSRDFVIGEVAGWGKVIEEKDRWRAEAVSPQSLALICVKCLDHKAQFNPAAYVIVTVHGWGRIFGRDGYDKWALCEAHAADSEIIPYREEGSLIPAHDIETELLERYDITRAVLPALPERPLTPELFENF